MPEIVRNGLEIAEKRRELNVEFGKLEKFISKFGKNPRMSDGVNPSTYSVYSNAFSNDILLRVGPSTDAVIQDLDYLTGRLNGMSETEFQQIANPVIANNKNRNYWQYTNPIWWIWEAIRFLWSHKIFASLFFILTVLAIDYSLAWENARKVFEFVFQSQPKQ